MNERDDELEQIQRWLLEVSEGTATAAETERMNALLAASAELRAAVARRLLDESLLCEELQIAAAESLFQGQALLPMLKPSASGESGAGELGAAASPRVSAWRRWRPWIGGAAAACLVMAVGYLSFWRSSGPNGADEEAVAILDTEGVALLTRAVDVRWEGSQSGARVNDRVAPGTLRIAAGLLQLEFFSGATVVLEGPAELEIVSAMRCECRYGKLRADVPPQASGFTVRTGQLDVVDLGTEFALRAERTGAGEVHVLNGEVSLQRGRKQEDRRVKEGGAVRFTSAGEFADLAVDQQSFVGSARLQELDRSSQAAAYERWRRHSRAWAQDPAMALYYDFENQEGAGRRLDSAVRGGSKMADGAIVGCRWTEGRFEGKRALEFKRTSDRVRVQLDGEFPSLSLVVWLRIEGFDRWYSSLLLSDGYDPGKVHWQVTGEGRLKFSASGWPGFASPPIIQPQDLGRWVQLATVFDHQAQEVRHYLDGSRASTHAVERQGPAMGFGSAEIGNWRPKKIGKDPIRSLNGRVDEIAVFRRALSDQEVRASYEAGTPGP